MPGRPPGGIMGAGKGHVENKPLEKPFYCPRRNFSAIFLFAVLNPAAAQLGWHFFPAGIGGFSLMQWLQGGVFLFILPHLFFRARQPNAESRLMLGLLALYSAGFAAIYLRAAWTGAVPGEYLAMERVWYARIIFVMVLWYYVAACIDCRERAAALLRCMVWGSLLVSLFIFYFRFAVPGGTVRDYALAGVAATFGAEGASGKGTTGFLVISVFISLYLWLTGRMRPGLFFCFVLLGAVALTFERASQAAFAAAAASLGGWYVLLARGKEYGRLKKFIFLLCFLGGGALYYFGADILLARWRYDISMGTIGSGRDALYAGALDWFARDSSPADILLGTGYGRVLFIMYGKTGLFVHTHSDLLDMLLLGGALGLLMYGALFRAAFRIIRGVDRKSIGFAVMVAAVICFGGMGLVTGLMSAVAAMFVFMSTLLAIGVIER